jgi:hypothetical protein
MQMILQSTRWDCLPTAFAMCLDILPIDIYKIVGHDGSEILWPDLDEPYRRRSFHIDEMVDVCITMAYSPVLIEREPVYAPLGVSDERLFKPYTVSDAKSRWMKYLKYHDAVLLGHTKNGKPHAVAWCHSDRMIYDPEGFKYPESGFDAHSAILIL